MVNIKIAAPVGALVLVLSFSGTAIAEPVQPYCGYSIKISQGVRQVHLGEISKGRHFNELWIRVGFWKFRYWKHAGYDTPKCH